MAMTPVVFRFWASDAAAAIAVRAPDIVSDCFDRDLREGRRSGCQSQH
jgi:hypothetical protein